MTVHFCTYFDHNYLSRALAMHASLTRHCEDFHLYVLALSEECREILSQLEVPRISVISLASVESEFSELGGAKTNRSRIEYVFTLSPAWPMYLFRTFDHIDQVTYLDGDLWFFSDPAIVFEEIGERSIAIVPHRFPDEQRSRERFGIYNVGWLTFRRDEAGLGCLQWWMEKCIEWCHDRVEEGRFADQGYLNDWTSRFDGVAVIENSGVNLAPWNIASHTLERGDGVTRSILVDGKPLVFFHFQGTRQVLPRVYDVGLREHGAPHLKIIRQHIYAPYIRELHAFELLLRRRFRNVRGTTNILRSPRTSPARLLKSAVHRDLMFAEATAVD